MILKSKKGALPLTLEQLTKLILFSIILFLVFIPLGVKLYNFYFPSIDKELKKTLNDLVLEAEDLRNDIEVHGINNPKITVPSYLVRGVEVSSYEPGAEGTPKKCRSHSCICIFQETPEMELFSCEVLDGLDVINPSIIKVEHTGIMNIEMVAERTGNKISFEMT